MAHQVCIIASMNPTSFWKLNLNERAELLWSKAAFMTSALYYNQRINLYYWNGTFIEVWYNPTTNKIVKITPVKNINLFKGYFKLH